MKTNLIFYRAVNGTVYVRCPKHVPVSGPRKLMRQLGVVEGTCVECERWVLRGRGVFQGDGVVRER